jgi:hypothetical protein
MLQDPFAQRVVIDNTACGVQKRRLWKNVVDSLSISLSITLFHVCEATREETTRWDLPP